MSNQREILATLSRGTSDSVERCATCGTEINAEATRAMLDEGDVKRHFCVTAHAKMYVRGRRFVSYDATGNEFLRAMGVL